MKNGWPQVAATAVQPAMAESLAMASGAIAALACAVPKAKSLLPLRQRTL